MKIGILRETKNPPDKRVPFTPEQCRALIEKYASLELVIQPSDYRCFSDQEYLDQGLKLQEDLSDCNVLMGVKEVKIDTLIPEKTYLFFSHTAKEQPYNRGLLQEIAKRKITLLDYEYLTRPDRSRVVAFGRWAGIVGAYNGLKAYGQRSSNYSLKPATELSGLQEMLESLKNLPIGDIRIVLTGGGRVASGAVEILKAAGIKEIGPARFLGLKGEGPLFTRLDPWHYTRHSLGKEFDFKHFVEHPLEYKNAFIPYALNSDMFIACHFWDPDAPMLLTADDLNLPEMKIQVIADISCDIKGPIASTIRTSTIAEPVYGYNPMLESESDEPFGKDVITVMAVDNLPGELPRDASEDFGMALMQNVIPALIGEDEDGIISRSCILQNGQLTSSYSYLKNYLEGVN